MTSLGQRYLTEKARERREEEKLTEMAKTYEEKRKIEFCQRQEENADNKRMMRLIQMRDSEKAKEDMLKKSEHDKRMRKLAEENEELLARQLERLKMDQVRDDKLRQQICKDSDVIRDLESKLRQAYVKKTRAAQIAEKQAIRYDEQMEDIKLRQALKLEHERAEQKAAEMESLRHGNKEVYMKDLEKQLRDKEEKRQRAYEEFLREKAMIDEMVRKIYDEDEREKELELEKKMATQEYIIEFQKARDAWKREEEARIAAENERIKQYVTMKYQRDTQLDDIKKHRDAAKALVQERIAAEISEKERERLEMEDIRQELALEEQEEKIRRQEIEAAERKLRQQLLAQKEVEVQRNFRAHQRQRELEEEEQIKAQMLAKFAEDDRIEQMNAQKRRMKLLEHKRAAEELLRQRREAIQRQKDEEAAQYRQNVEMEEWKRRIIEEERQRLLQEHAQKLIGYLPRGVILSEEDAKMLGPEFMQEYRHTEIDPYDLATIDKYNPKRS